MKIPKNINKITVNSEIEKGAYPPNGFLMFDEACLGNGDYFGLYWEFGKENEYPIICEIEHDNGIITPRFSSLNKFLEWYELNDYDWGEKEIVDEKFILEYLKKGNEYVKNNNPEKAIEQYKLGTKSFGELSKIWLKLAAQQRRLGNQDEFQKSIIKAFLSNWTFGIPSENTIRIIRNLKPIPEFENHPLIKYKDELIFKFGGTKENSIYLTLKKMINELFENGIFKEALMLEQNYALMMNWETISSQKRYGFDYEKWKDEFMDKTLKYFKRGTV